ncbi:MAG TPA: TetR/AcrR family transcriptional regulator [Solirubrobacteraceae bacterium]|nr:TetR/AcrR family transcriptional regulator [Solirubrobacteraceae bacterium]
MIELAAERGGYGAVTVSKVVARARVSPRSFYEHFKDKDECFLATYDAIALRSARRIGDAQVGMRDWRQRLALAFRTWTNGIAGQPKMARLALIEAFAGGPAALARMRRAEEMFEAMIACSFARAPDRLAVPPLLVKGIVAGVHRVARARLLAGRASELPDLAEELLEWMLCFRCDAAALARLRFFALAAQPGAKAVRAEQRGDTAGGGTDDRTRILDAVERLAASEGYWRLTVPRIRTAAGISRGCFDEHFADVQHCFVATLERHAELMRAHSVAAGTRARTWPGTLHRAMHALCAYVAANPAPSRLVFTEILAPGPDGMRHRERLIAKAAETLRTSGPAGQRPSELAAEASAGAVWGLVDRHIASGHARRLPRIAPTLSFLAASPAIGAQGALAAIAAEHGRMAASDVLA